MSADDTEDRERDRVADRERDRVPKDSGLPGYPHNVVIPRGFELPVPVPASEPRASSWSVREWAEDAADVVDDPYAAELTPDAGDPGQPGEFDADSPSEILASDAPAETLASDAPAETLAMDDRGGTGEGGTAAYGTAAYGIERAGEPGDARGPSAESLISARVRGERRRTGATSGWRRAFGLGPSLAERTERERVERIARPLDGRKTVMVINTKGGGGKTLVTLMLASYLARHRSGSVLAWDNNETEGTLGMRSPSQPHHRTVVDLLGALPQIAQNPLAGPAELQHWVREQRGLNFDVLASADDDEAMRIIGEDEFDTLHRQLSRFYRMILIDTGNNRLAPNWLAAAAQADLLVFATSLKDDTSVVAAKNLDSLVAMGREDLVRNAVCVISHTSPRGDLSTGVHTREHFEQWVRAVVEIPFDPMLTPGLRIDPLKVARRTDEACLEMTAVVVDGL
ncbi:MAG: hypothetical protein L0H25_02025 [Micrococcales bacterium]|nr:hypothetical protein [Micrococcales bacterium]